MQPDVNNINISILWKLKPIHPKCVWRVTNLPRLDGLKSQESFRPQDDTLCSIGQAASYPVNAKQDVPAPGTNQGTTPPPSFGWVTRSYPELFQPEEPQAKVKGSCMLHPAINKIFLKNKIKYWNEIKSRERWLENQIQSWKLRAWKEWDSEAEEILLVQKSKSSCMVLWHLRGAAYQCRTRNLWVTAGQAIPKPAWDPEEVETEWMVGSPGGFLAEWMDWGQSPKPSLSASSAKDPLDPSIWDWGSVTPDQTGQKCHALKWSGEEVT